MSKSSKRSRKYGSILKRNMKVSIKPHNIYKTDKDNVFSGVSPLDVKYNGIPYGVILNLYEDLKSDFSNLKTYCYRQNRQKSCGEKSALTWFYSIYGCQVKMASLY